MATARAYSLKTVPEDQKFRGQAELIMNVLRNVKEPLTTATIAGLVGPKLVTRQDPERVVAFYMAVWKKKGWISYVDQQVDDVEAAASNTADEAPQNVHEETGPIEADEHAEIQQEVAVETSGDGDEHATLEESQSFPNLSGKKLSEAILAVLDFKAKTLTVEQLVATFKSNGYDFNTNQVNSAVQNLIRKESIVKTERGISLA